jgi:putative DNA methylase
MKAGESMPNDETQGSAVDRRLIEDYIPIEAISAEARREKSIRKGHISTLHLWWARRPLVAARAAVYGALVPAPAKEKAREAAEFVAALCKYPGGPETIAEARRHVLQAHAGRLTAESGQLVTVEDIEAGRAPRPRVLDMFAGGGAIPLEALRLGCEAYALDLNPVAHLIELCTLVYPQQFGAPDRAAKGSAPDGTWAGLAAEVEHWGKWVLERVRAEIGDLYPPIPDPRPRRGGGEGGSQLAMDMAVQETREGYQAKARMLVPVAYLWTRTVCCKNPACGATVPLARQTWLARKKGRFVALRADGEMSLNRMGVEKRVRYVVVEARSMEALRFDPATGSRGGNIACPFCGTVANSSYVKLEGQAGHIGTQLLAVVCTRPGKRGKVYLAAHEVPSFVWPDEDAIEQRIRALEAEATRGWGTPLTTPDEALPLVDARGAFFVKLYGIANWGQLFTPRQLLSLLTIAKHVRVAHATLLREAYGVGQAKAVATYLGILLDRLADYNSSLCSWHNTGEKIGHTYARQALPMVWDFVELNPLGSASGNAMGALAWITGVIASCTGTGVAGYVGRGSGTQLPFEPATFDAIITDPPYYDNVPYSDLSDFFYVWLKRSVGSLYPEHFSSLVAPKKQEAIMDSGRHARDAARAKLFYEEMMAKAFTEAGRTLKPGAPLVIVYAHKTTAGWATLVDALRSAGFTVTEAWPLDTEMGARLRAVDSAALASSIFLVARRREGDGTGSYEREVQPELREIVRERVDRLWAQGVTGADLVIACVGAGLRAFTRFGRVEYANGEPVAADAFLAEVEGEVLETLLEKLFGISRAGVRSVDGVTRFYVLWRYAYRHAALDGGEAIVFAYPQRVELDGPGGLSSGSNPLVEKRKGRYRLRDFAERGADRELGMPHGRAEPSAHAVAPAPRRGELAPTIDALHRLLWLVEHRPGEIGKYLDEATPDVERLRVVAQTLAGHTLAGNGNDRGRSPGVGRSAQALTVGRGAEAAALRKLTTNWRTLIEAHRGPLA